MLPTIHRDRHGIPHIKATDDAALFFGQGMAHATDRAMQILLLRLVGQGRVSEVLDSSDDSLRVDQFFRRLNWSGNSRSPLEKLSPSERAMLEAYCQGVNQALARSIPWEFKLLRHRPEPWQPEDTVLLLRMLGYLTLAASQGEIERVFVEMVQAGVTEEKLHELFPGILGGLDVELIKQVKLGQRLVPSELWGLPLPRMMASNNWVLSGRKTVSGKPLLANDVHLEGNRLPGVWCEMSLRCRDRHLLGGTLPGIPGVPAGRNNDLTWGMTYAFVDAEDSWIEKCREGISGFVPLPGWKRENDWQGFVPPRDLPRAKNPPEGFFATANEDLNRYGRSRPINMPMGRYRADRIRELLAARDNFAVEDMRAMHFDVYSRQADLFMKILRPLLPPSPAADLLRDWDLKYTADSEGAWRFEQFYAELYREVFGKGGLGEQVVDALRLETGAFIDFYHNFDRVLLSEASAWFGGRTREEIFRLAATVALQSPPKKWGEAQQFVMTNIFFNGELPRFLGFDRGPYVAIGNRATIHQAQLYRSHGRQTSFLPSYRFIADLGEDHIHTTLAGSPSDRRFSRWYASNLRDWLQGRYKTLAAT